MGWLSDLFGGGGDEAVTVPAEQPTVVPSSAQK